eukprot:TRINITY_DN16480_c0_g2_i1.p1 TRINITY_DN16480_c0_g2~~TRINITY_DN16480_c0_g2_i1.p1  ORF type:complete len:356 (+),score=22.71 TRINITY_DN16480_c0_g2_i1:732-1799(+)
MDSKIFSIGCEKELDLFWYYFEKKHCCFEAMSICYHVVSEHLYNHKEKSVDILYTDNDNHISLTIKSSRLIDAFKKHITHFKPNLEIRIVNQEIELVQRGNTYNQKIYLDEDKKIKNSPYESKSCEKCEFYDFSNDSYDELIEDEVALHSKVSSHSYREQISLDSSDLQTLGDDLKESIEIIRDILYSIDDALTPKGLLKHISKELITFSKRVGELLEFKLISVSIESIAQKLERLSADQVCTKSIRIFVESVIDDLESWIVNILEGNSVDIHYLDHSISSSSRQLDQLLKTKTAQESIVLDIERLKSIIEKNSRKLSIEEWIYETKLNPFLPINIKEELIEWLYIKASSKKLHQ